MLVNTSAFLFRSCPFNIQRFLMSSSKHVNKNLGSKAKFLDKLLNSSKKKRKHFICETPTPSGGNLSMRKEFRSNKENSRRTAVLNKLFIKSISDLLATGSFSENVLEKGLDITRVAISPNYNQLSVYWSANNEKNLNDLEVILPGLGFTLRHELSQLRVVGVVPRIVFVKDKHNANALKVDSLLKIADFGEDHEPCLTESDFNHTQTPPVNISPSQEGDVKTAEDCGAEDQRNTVEVMPEMRHDTFNLNHARIMEKIKKSMYKTRACHRFEPNLAISGEGTNLPNSTKEMAVDNMTKQERKLALSKFILERRLQKERAYRDKYNSQINVPVYEINNIEDVYEYEDLSTEDFIDDEYFEDEKLNK